MRQTTYWCDRCDMPLGDDNSGSPHDGILPLAVSTVSKVDGRFVVYIQVSAQNKPNSANLNLCTPCASSLVYRSIMDTKPSGAVYNGLALEVKRLVAAPGVLAEIAAERDRITQEGSEP